MVVRSRTSHKTKSSHWFTWLGIFMLLLAGLYLAFDKQGNRPAMEAELSPTDLAERGKILKLGEFYAFSYHPSAKAKAFVKKSRTNPAYNYLYVQKPDGTTQLLHEMGNVWPQIELAWSPDGAQLAIAWQEKKSHILHLRLDSQLNLVESTKLAEDDRNKYSSIGWLDNQTILISRAVRTSNQFHLYTLSLETLEFLLYRDAKQTALMTAQKGYVAYAKNHKRAPTIQVINPVGQQIFTYTSQQPIFAMSFLPKLNGLLLSTKKGPRLVHFNGQVSAPELRAKSVMMSPQFSRDGELLYFLMPRENLDIYWDKLKGDYIIHKPMELSSGQDRQARCRSAFNDFVFVSDRSGSAQLWLHKGSDGEQLTELFEGTEISHLVVSPDKQQFIFKANQDILLHNLITRETQILLTNAGTITPLGLDKGQQHLYYAQQVNTHSLQMNYWRYNLASKRSEQLDIPQSLVEQAIVSEGELYYLAKDTHVYQWQPTGAQPSTSLFPHDSRFVAENSDKLYYFLPRRGQRKRIWSYDKESGSHQVVLKRDQYQGQLNDVCDDNRVLFELDMKKQVDLYRINASHLL